MTTREQGEPRVAASVGTSFRRQLWLLGVSRRWIYPIAALVGMLMILPDDNDPAVAVGGALVGFLGAFWPMAVWFGETPGRRTYHWSLPVPRAGHDLMRVLAGAIYLVVISVAVALAGIVIDGSFASSFGPARTILLLMFVLVPLVTYFLMTALALWSDYPITRWVLGSFVAFAFGSVVLQRAGFQASGEWITALFFGGEWSFAFTLLEGIFTLSEGKTTPDPDWLTAIVLWLAFGLLLTLITAALRPDDVKRRLRSGRARQTAATRA